MCVLSERVCGGWGGGRGLLFELNKKKIDTSRHIAGTSNECMDGSELFFILMLVGSKPVYLLLMFTQPTSFFNCARRKTQKDFSGQAVVLPAASCVRLAQAFWPVVVAAVFGCV